MQVNLSWHTHWRGWQKHEKGEKNLLHQGLPDLGAEQKVPFSLQVINFFSFLEDFGNVERNLNKQFWGTVLQGLSQHTRQSTCRLNIIYVVHNIRLKGKILISIKKWSPGKYNFFEDFFFFYLKVPVIHHECCKCLYLRYQQSSSSILFARKITLGVPQGPVLTPLHFSFHMVNRSIWSCSFFSQLDVHF